MRPLTFLAGLALLLALPPAACLAQKKGGKDAPSVIDSADLPAGTYAGTLLSAPGSDGSFTLQVKAQVPSPEGGGARGAGGDPQRLLRNIVQQQQRLEKELARRMQPGRGPRAGNNRGRGRGNPIGQARRQQQEALRRLVRGQGGGGVKMTTVTYTIDFQAREDVAVRALEPLEAFDEKGNIKTYTAAELRKLKGSNPRLPGYEAKRADLTPGKIVQVTLSPRPRPKEGAGAVDAETKKMQAGLILILAEGDPPGEKRKKK